MKNVIYTGALNAGSVDHKGSEFPFKRGEPIQVPQTLAAELIPTTDWKEATPEDLQAAEQRAKERQAAEDQAKAEALKTKQPAPAEPKTNTAPKGTK